MHLNQQQRRVAETILQPMTGIQTQYFNQQVTGNKRVIFYCYAKNFSYTETSISKNIFLINFENLCLQENISL